MEICSIKSVDKTEEYNDKLTESIINEDGNGNEGFVDCHFYLVNAH